MTKRSKTPNSHKFGSNLWRALSKPLPAKYYPAEGDIIWVTLYVSDSRTEKHRRPAVVISSDMNNVLSNGMAIVCPISSETLPGDEYIGLPDTYNVEGQIRTNQVYTIDCTFCGDHYPQLVGHLETKLLVKVQSKVAANISTANSGEVVWVELYQSNSREIQKRRPAVVLATDQAHGTITVCPITSRRRINAAYVDLPEWDGPTGQVVTNQIYTIKSSPFGEHRVSYVAKLPETLIQKIQAHAAANINIFSATLLSV